MPTGRSNCSIQLSNCAERKRPSSLLRPNQGQQGEYLVDLRRLGLEGIASHYGRRCTRTVDRRLPRARNPTKRASRLGVPNGAPLYLQSEEVQLHPPRTAGSRWSGGLLFATPEGRAEILYDSYDYKWKLLADWLNETIREKLAT